MLNKQILASWRALPAVFLGSLALLLILASVAASARALTMAEVLSASSKTKRIKLNSFALPASADNTVTVTALPSSGGASLGTEILTPDANGVLTVTVNSTTAIPDNVNLRVKPSRYLSKLITNVDLSNTATQQVSQTFIAGDVNDDNVINTVDRSIISSKWATSDSQADLNGDGIVNSLDAAQVIYNINQAGE